MPQIKERVIAVVCEKVHAELDAMRAAALSAHDAATHEEARPENDKDTRSVEAAYLAGAQAARAAELEQVWLRLQSLRLAQFDKATPLGTGALVQLQFEARRTPEWVLLLSIAGGFSVDVDGRRVKTVTPASPLGNVLTGSLVGDELEYDTPLGVKAFTILSVE